MGSGHFRRILSAQVARAGAVAAFIRAAGLLLVFGLQVFLARTIADQAEYGLFAWGQNLMFLLGSLFALGIPLASSRMISIHAHYGRDSAQQAVIRRAAVLMVVFSSCFVAVALLIAFRLPADVMHKIPTEITILAIAAAPLVSFTLLYQAIGRARSLLVAAFLPTQVLRPLLTGLLALGFLLAGSFTLGAFQALAAVAVSLALVLMLQLSLTHRIRKVCNNTEPNAEIDPAHSPDRLLGQALPVFATRFSELITKYASIFVLGFLAGPIVVAGYFVAERLAQLTAIPAMVVNSVIQPWLASASAANDRSRMQQVITQAIHTGLWPTLVATGAVYAASGLLLGLFGPDFEEAAPVLLLLMLAHLVTVLLGPNSQILVMSGRQQTVFRIMTGAAILHLILISVLIPAHGAAGAASAAVISALVSGGACLGVVRFQLRLKSSILLSAGRRSVNEETRSDETR